MYTHGHTTDTATLPLNLLDALRTLAGNRALRDVLGAAFVDSFVKLKMKEWNAYLRHFTRWEHEHTLDC